MLYAIAPVIAGYAIKVCVHAFFDVYTTMKEPSTCFSGLTSLLVSDTCLHLTFARPCRVHSAFHISQDGHRHFVPSRRNFPERISTDLNHSKQSYNLLVPSASIRKKTTSRRMSYATWKSKQKTSLFLFMIRFSEYLIGFANRYCSIEIDFQYFSQNFLRTNFGVF